MKKEQKEFLEARFKEWHVPGWNELLAKLKEHGGEMMVPKREPAEHVKWLLETH